MVLPSPDFQDWMYQKLSVVVAGFMVLGVTLLFTRSSRAMFFAFFCAALLAWFYQPKLNHKPPFSMATIEESSLSLVLVNCSNFSDKPKLDLAEITQNGVELLILQEVTPADAYLCRYLDEIFPFKACFININLQGTAVFSQTPIKVEPIAEVGFCIALETEVGVMQVLVTKTLPPYGKLGLSDWETNVETLRTKAAELTAQPIIVAGDLGVPAWDIRLKDFAAALNLQNAGGQLLLGQENSGHFDISNSIHDQILFSSHYKKLSINSLRNQNNEYLGLMTYLQLISPSQ